MKKLQNNCVQMKAPYPLPSPDSVEEKGGAPRTGGAIPSPRRHDMKQWLHGHHQQHSTVDSPTVPPLLYTTPGQPPSPPFLKKRSPQSKSQSHHRDEHEGQQQQQQNASAFVAAFLRDAASASVTVPTKISDHNSRCGSKKSSSDKRQQQRLMRQNIYGSARSDASGNISLSSSIDNLSECLNELAKSSTKKGEKLKITTITTKQSEREGRKGCPRRLSSRCGDDDDVSLVSNLSGWNELVEKTFGYDDPDTESEQFLLGLHKHATANVGEEKSYHRYDGGGSLELERNGSGHHRIDPTGTTLTPNTSSPNTSKTPPALKPILKVNCSDTAADATESISADSLLDELVALDDSYLRSCTDTALDDSYKKSCTTSALDDSYKTTKTSCTDSDMLEQFLAGMEPKGNGSSEKGRRKRQSKGLSSSMGNIFDMMEDMFCGDEVEEHHSFDRFEEQNQNPFASTKERSSASERARIERLKKKKAAMHTRALQDSAQSKPTAHTSSHKPRTRNNSYDDADRFLRSLEEASAALHKAKMNDDTHDQREREEGLNFSGTSSKAVYRSRGDEDAKSFDAFDEMLAEIKEEERRMDSALFGSKSKSRQSEHLLNKRKEGDMHKKRETCNHNSSLSRHTTKVICLKWVDRRGMAGHFTGEVNSMIQPHGKGILVYENGLVLDCNWCNGTPSAGINDDTAATSQKGHVAVVSDEKSNQFLPDYDLGMAARSRHDMKEEDPDKAMEGISRLKKLDFTFVRRSNKQWTYSIICDRTEDSIRFVIDEVGRTKKISRDRWLKNIRRIQKSSSRHHKTQSQHHRRRSTSVPTRRKKLEP